MNARHHILFAFTIALVTSLFLQTAASQTAAGRGTPACADPLLCYYGGPLLQSTQTVAVFWGPEWSNASFAGDKISGMDTFFAGYGGSHLASLATEYSLPLKPISANSTYLGHLFDLTAPPTIAPTNTQLLGQACAVADNFPVGNNVILLFASNMPSNFPWCGYRTSGTCGQGSRKKTVFVSFIPNLDGAAQCDAQDIYTSHSSGLAAIANVAAANLLATATDPQGTGWHDSSGRPMPNKCARVYPPAPQTLSNGSQWYTWAEWSNAAYKAGTGLLSNDGYAACIY